VKAIERPLLGKKRMKRPQAQKNRAKWRRYKGKTALRSGARVHRRQNQSGIAASW
jgi:hypothetical protein